MKTARERAEELFADDCGFMDDLLGGLKPNMLEKATKAIQEAEQAIWDEVLGIIGKHCDGELTFGLTLEAKPLINAIKAAKERQGE